MYFRYFISVMFIFMACTILLTFLWYCFFLMVDAGAYVRLVCYLASFLLANGLTKRLVRLPRIHSWIHRA